MTTISSATAIRSTCAWRRIAHVVHFTHYRGVIGILNEQALLSTRELQTHQSLGEIRKLTWEDRTRDASWLGYASLSIGHINTELFGRAQRNHADPEESWFILQFTAEILSHPGVLFVTTNNAYQCAIRAPGITGLNNLFQTQVVAYDSGTIRYRSLQQAPGVPTCPQAEVLYPGSVSLLHCTGIVTSTMRDEADLTGVIEAIRPRFRPPIYIQPEAFN